MRVCGLFGCCCAMCIMCSIVVCTVVFCDVLFVVFAVVFWYDVLDYCLCLRCCVIDVAMIGL